LQVLHETEKYLCAISGMERFSFQPAGGTQAIYANMAATRAHHQANGEGDTRDEVITTIFSHPGNPGAAATAGYKILTLMPDENGLPDFETLKAVVSKRTAALLITNPEDTGLFNPRIKEFTDLVHSFGGLCVYDQANLNGIVGIARAKEAGFDMLHFNLHKTFSSPHGSQGPGVGAQGVIAELAKYLPKPTVEISEGKYHLEYNRPHSIGKVRKFLGVVPVVLRAYAYIRNLGAEGLCQVSETSILNNNYLIKRMLSEVRGLNLPMASGTNRLDQARFSWQAMKDDTGVGTSDVNRRAVDFGLQSYFTSHHPQVIAEPFTPEPVETYSKADIDEYVAIFKQIATEAYSEPLLVQSAPHRSTITGPIDNAPLLHYDQFACTWRGYKKLGGQK
ncbi:MAG: aminotransferase class V-fold PLP-dependent enzyme, partial [bacterium]|nr:aminotransferase class V-fold PLP-dependent enzyme [bacterium]